MDAIKIIFIVLEVAGAWVLCRGVGMMSPKQTLPWVVLFALAVLALVLAIDALVVISG